MGPIGVKQGQMVPNDAKKGLTGQNLAKRAKRAKRGQMGPSGAKMGPNRAKRGKHGQMGSNGAKK